jgi:MFS family permease
VRRGLIPPIGSRGWRLLGGQTLSDLGTGLTLPFLIVYLHEVRGLSLPTAGVVIAAISAIGLTAMPVGTLVDRFGPARVLVVALVLSGAGAAGFAAVREPWHAFAAALVYGLGLTSTWNALSSQLATVAPTQRGAAFGLSFALSNLGVGLGGIVGGFVVDVDAPRTFELVFLVDAASFWVFAVFLLVTGEVRAGRPASGDPEEGADGEEEPVERAPSGYRAVLSDGALVATVGLNALLIIAAGSQLSSAFPAYATGDAGSTTRVVGFAFAANTFVIVLAQLFVIRHLEGKRRTNAAAAAAALFGCAWVVTLVAGEFATGAATAVGLVAALAIFGLGETLFAPTLPALVNDLAPDHLRGRYNAVSNLSIEVGSLTGPILAGAALGAGLGGAYFGFLAAACAVVAVAAVSLARIIPPAANRGSSPSADEEAATTAATPA